MSLYPCIRNDYVSVSLYPEGLCFCILVSGMFMSPYPCIRNDVGFALLHLCTQNKAYVELLVLLVNERKSRRIKNLAD